jgi:hypothetical protein
MYGIYANIWGILMVNVTIYSIHGSYGYWLLVLSHPMIMSQFTWDFLLCQLTGETKGCLVAGGGCYEMIHVVHCIHLSPCIRLFVVYLF